MDDHRPKTPSKITYSSKHSFDQMKTSEQSHDEILMQAYKEAAPLSFRFVLLGLGIAGLFFPGWVLHQMMRIFKSMLSNKDAIHVLSLTEPYKEK